MDGIHQNKYLSDYRKKISSRSFLIFLELCSKCINNFGCDYGSPLEHDTSGFSETNLLGIVFGPHIAPENFSVQIVAKRK